MWHRSPNMDSLIAVGSGAALIYGTAALLRMAYAMGHGDWETVTHYSENLYFESAAMILTLITVGKFLETRAKGKTGDAIRSLMDLSPKTASVLRDGQEVSVPADQVRVGDVVVARAGGQIPVDGTVLEGHAAVDQSALTGESVPRDVTVGDEVISGCINLSGVLEIRTTKEFGESTVSKILDLVENASSKKSKTESVISKIASWYTLGVIVASIIVFGIVWLVVGDITTAIYRGLIFLVVSCLINM